MMHTHLGRKLSAMRSRAVDRVLTFQPSICDLDIAGAPVRFLLATPQAADWYDPLKAANRRELEWLIAHVAPGAETIVDAGAFHGLYGTVLGKAAGVGARVVAIDPVPANCAVSEANLALNGVESKVVCAAVSNTSGNVRFSRDTCGRVLPSGGIEVRADRIAAIAPEADVVKLDIEGEEFVVVPDQIDECARVRAWIVEIHPGRGGDPSRVTGAFASKGFSLWWSRPDGGAIEPYDGQEWRHRGTLVALRS